GRPVVARPVGWAGRVARWCRRSPRVAALSGAVGVLAAVAVGLGVAAVVNLAQTRAQARTIADQERDARVQAEAIAAEQANARTKADQVARLEREAKDKAAAETILEQKRVAHLQVSEGARLLEAGDVTGAALWFVAALGNEPDPAGAAARLHRVRIGTTLRASPRLRQSTMIDSVIGLSTGQLAADGSAVLFGPGLPVRVWG